MSQFKVGDRFNGGDGDEGWVWVVEEPNLIRAIAAPAGQKERVGITTRFTAGEMGQWLDRKQLIPDAGYHARVAAESMVEYAGYYDAITEHSLPPAEPQD